MPASVPKKTERNHINCEIFIWLKFDESCGKIFTQDGGLKHHLRIHIRGERPFECVLHPYLLCVVKPLINARA